MTTVLVVVLAVVFGVTGIAKIVAAPPMRTAARHLGFTVGQYRIIGVLELAGAVGLVVGLAVPGLGVAATVGLGMLLVGAAVAHVRNHDPAGRVAVPIVLIAVVAACGAAIAGAA